MSVRDRADLNVTYDTTRLAARMDEIRQRASKEFGKQVRKELSTAVKPLLDAQRQAVRGLNSSGSRGGGRQQRFNAAASRSMGPLTLRQFSALNRRSGLREAVARTLRVVNRSRGSSYQLTITADSSRMPAGQSSLPMAMNRGSWRHPVYGNTNRWVAQKVTPAAWFDKTADQHRAAIFDAVARAISNALNRL